MITPDVHAALGGWAIEYKPLLTPAAFDELERRVMALVAQERERCARVADGYIDTKRTFDDDGSVNYHAGFIDGALAVREAIRALE